MFGYPGNRERERERLWKKCVGIIFVNMDNKNI